MAKNNNLKDFLTDVADAIRSKTGEAGLINPQDFSARIASIQTGGDGGDTPTPSPTPSASKGDVTFYDYDGVVLHSYSKDAFLALTELPALPSRSGLVCQGWNWSFEDAIAYVGECGKLNVGATYITDDGRTRLYISIPENGKRDVPIRFVQMKANGVIIHWGDGTSEQTGSSTSNTTYTHSYAASGDYCIALESINGCEIRLGGGNSSYSIVGAGATGSVAYRNYLRKVEIGEGAAYVRTYAFTNCTSLTAVSIPNSAIRIDESAFYYCTSLKFITIPNNLTTIASSSFYYCYSLVAVSIPNSVTSVSSGFFAGCSSLEEVIIPNSMKSIPARMCSECYGLSSVIIPDSVTSIGEYAFNKCYSLPHVTVPRGVASIGKGAFAYCYSFTSVTIGTGVTSIADNLCDFCYGLSSVKILGPVTSIGQRAFYACSGVTCYDFSESESIPETIGSNAFYNNVGYKIVVPDALYDEWIAHATWSGYSGVIVKKSEYIR